MRKPTFCICENKGADQRAAHQHLCFRNMDSTIPLLSTSEILNLWRRLAIFCDCTARFVSDLIGNPEDRFSHDGAHMLDRSHSQRPVCNENLC